MKNKDIIYNVKLNTEDAEKNVQSLDNSIADLSITTLETAKSVGEIKKALKDADTLKLSGSLSATELQRLSAAMGQAKDRVADLREETASLAGTRTEILRNNFARLKDSIFSLDIDKFKSSISGLKTGLMGAEGGFKGLGKAIVASGVGALVIIVGLLIANFDKLAGAGGLVGKIFTGVGEIIKSVTKFFTDLTDAIGLTSIATNEAAASQRAYNDAVKEGAANLNTLYIKGLRGRARETAELNKQITDDLKANQDKQNEITAKAAEEKRALTKDELRRLEDLKKEGLQIYENGELSQKELTQKFAKEDEETRKKNHAKKLADIEKRIKEEAAKEAEMEAKRVEFKKAAEDKIKADFEEEEKKRKLAGGSSTNIFKSLGLPTPEQAKDASKKITETKQKNNEDEIAATKAKREAIDNIEATAVDAANQLMDSLGANDEAKKALALADIAYNTGTALTNALTTSSSPTPDNIATGGLATFAKYAGLAIMITTNAAKAINIVKSKKPASGGSGGGGAPSFSGTSGKMPTVTSLPEFQNNMTGIGNKQLNNLPNQKPQTIQITQRELVDNQQIYVNQREQAKIG